MHDPSYGAYGVPQHNPFSMPPAHGSAHGMPYMDSSMLSPFRASAYPSGSTTAYSGYSLGAPGYGGMHAMPAYPMPPPAPVMAQPAPVMTKAPMVQQRDGYGMLKAADASHGSSSLHVQHHDGRLYPEMALQMRTTGSRAANATWPPELLHTRSAGEKVTSKSEFREPVKEKGWTHLAAPPANAREMLEKFKEPHEMLVLDKQLAVHHGLEAALGEHGPHGLLLHGVHKGIYPVARLDDYGPRKVSYMRVPVPEENSGVVISREFVIPEAHHRFDDSVHHFHHFYKDDDGIRNTTWRKQGPWLRKKEDSDSESELQDELKHHADYRLSRDIRGLRRERYMGMQQMRAAGGVQQTAKGLKGGILGSEVGRYDYYTMLRMERSRIVTEGLKQVHHEHVHVAEDLTDFFKNSEEVLKEFADLDD
eukprot:TRINITY_DN9750_c0_g1_i1.p1 TRINITY_DN9750_c0_g1~~TRINITY_DN9750_c0_g1_i1.p1  ORF type:complete len:421 (-),score=97.17 TRINITY_DN9750_c0_g1_i1:39-1301(-)